MITSNIWQHPIRSVYWGKDQFSLYL